MGLVILIETHIHIQKVLYLVVRGRQLEPAVGIGGLARLYTNISSVELIMNFRYPRLQATSLSFCVRKCHVLH